jgi:glycosyltransferase involved in cell wall biosynthesis
VSVVVPARNAAGTISEQIRALAVQQVGVPWELVVVDNGSTDGTARVAEATFPAHVPSRVVTARTRTGAAHARNVGVRAASGDLLAFCDADDRVRPGWLASLVAGSETADAVTGTVDLTTLNPPSVAGGHTALAGNRVDGVSLPPLFGIVTNGNNLAVWRHAFDAVGGFEEGYRGGSEDKDLGYRLQAAGFRVVVRPDAVVAMRLRARWGPLARQQFWRGHEDVRLYRRFGPAGYPARGMTVGCRTAAGLVRDVAKCRDRASRVAWWIRAARFAGRVRGSLTYRVLYL